MADVLLSALPQSMNLAPTQRDQYVNPWTWIFNTSGSQLGLFNFNVNLGQSSDPEKEKAALSVASYGKQLGRIEDLLDTLVSELQLARKYEEDSKDDKAVRAYRAMREEITEALK